MFDQRLTQGFNSLLMKYIPKLFCFEVKPDSLYTRTDFISLLLNASVLNCYLDGLGYASRDLGGRVPTGETALSYIKSIDRYELESVTWILLEEQLNELKAKGLLNRPVPIAFDWNARCSTETRIRPIWSTGPSRRTAPRTPTST